MDNEMSHAVSTPASADPATLPRAPTAKATETAPRPTRRVAIALAPITRPQLGTSVKVVSPLRWLHSPVTARIAMIGKITDIGNPLALTKFWYVTSLWRPRTRSDPAEMGDRTPMLMSIQNPERVLNILRSSTLTRRVVGMGRPVRRTGAASMVSGEMVVAVMPQLLRVGCRR